ncbi:hypothetical protein ABIB62_004482 [Mucilaginibacter sp. UYP25]
MGQLPLIKGSPISNKPQDIQLYFDYIPTFCWCADKIFVLHTTIPYHISASVFHESVSDFPSMVKNKPMTELNYRRFRPGPSLSRLIADLHGQGYKEDYIKLDCYNCRCIINGRVYAMDIMLLQVISQIKLTFCCAQCLFR